jgi:plastocyanin
MRYMRSLHLLLGLSLVAGCITGEIGPTGGDDDEGGGGGDGSGSGSGSGSNTDEPRVMLTTDNPTVNTELGTTSMITVNVDTANFTGPVNLVASVINPTTMVAVPGWAVTLSTPTVNVTADGMMPVVATLTIPAENAGELSGQVKIDATSSMGTTSVTSTVTALNQVTITVAANGNQCAYPANNTTVKVGTKVRFLNKTADDLSIHSGGPIPHLGQAGAPAGQPATTAVDGAYEVTVAAAGTASWYCHAPGPNLQDANPSVIVVP